MRSLRSDDLIDDFDRRLSNYLFPIMAAALVAVTQLAVVVSVARWREYSQYEFCVTSECFKTFYGLIQAQVEFVKAGAAVVSFCVVAAGLYLALRTYLSTSQVGMLGNAISHITFYERFVTSEIARRGRMSSRHVDVFAIYGLMFPASHSSQRFASDAFVQSVLRVYGVVSESSSRYDSRKSVFKFDDHRRRLISALEEMHIWLEPIPRVDFLEVEDEVLDFLSMLCRVFSPPGSEVNLPVRTYR